MSCSEYLKMTEICRQISTTFLSPSDFERCYHALDDEERKSLVSHVIVHNTPFAFQNTPLLYEQIISYLSDYLKIERETIKLIGSAKTGFSISGGYGRPFSGESDLDFTIINGELFERLKKDFQKWKIACQENKIEPGTPTEKKYWDNNLNILPRNIKRGFIDTHYLPNREVCLEAQRIAQAMSLITINLSQYYNITNKKASVRVYKDYEAFYRQLYINLKSIFPETKD